MNEWEDYWRQGNVSCFPDDPKLNRLLSTAWSEAFRLNIKEKSCSILDLACGGGYLTSLLVEEYKNTDSAIELSLSDICDISVESSSSNVNLQLFPKINNESLPFTKKTFDFIISNFGFEYSEKIQTINELSRVLSDTGRFVLNCHHVDSQIIKDSVDISNALVLWLETSETQNLILELFSKNSAGQHIDKNKQSKLLIDEFVNINNKTNGGISKSGLLESILPLLKNNIQQMETIDEYNILELNYKNYLKRIQAQVNAALTNEKIEVIKDQFLRNNIKLDEIRYLSLEDKIVSVYIQGSREHC
jgi:ubiquinone/menaquinone biosynthesis C-methylase UbiE